MFLYLYMRVCLQQICGIFVGSLLPAEVCFQTVAHRIYWRREGKHTADGACCFRSFEIVLREQERERWERERERERGWHTHTYTLSFFLSLPFAVEVHFLMLFLVSWRPCRQMYHSGLASDGDGHLNSSVIFSLFVGTQKEYL